MKMKIYLEAEGQENLANGKQIWPWQYVTRTNERDAPKLAVLVGECEITLPTKETCIPTVLAMLEESAQKINATAHEDLRAIAERRENLLALTYTEASK